MSANVISFADRQIQRDDAYWDRQARALGFKNFESLSKANDEEFDAQCEWLQENCTHADKLPGLEMCEKCAEGLCV